MDSPASSSSPLPTALDLFAGSGSATAALKASGFQVSAAIDNDKHACATYRLNHPEVNLYEASIQDIDPENIKQESLGGDALDIIVICAPCQPFSSQNQKRGRDLRARLLISAARFVAIMKPVIVFVENVPGLASAASEEILGEFRDTCGSDYSFGDPVCVDAADYGVPQRRKRCLLLGARRRPVPEIPAPTTPRHQRHTVREAIAGLRSLRAGQVDPEDPLHTARAHRPMTLERLRAISKDGGSRSDLPDRLILTCHKDHRGHPDVYGRMRWDDVAPTLTTGCTDLTRGRFAHPRDDRAITAREAALLQTFPRDYKFAGPLTVVAQQIGNALPFGLLQAIAPSLRTSLEAGD